MEDNIRISSAAVSERGLSEKRPQNEDSFLEIGQSGIFAVADGVGGAQAGEVASQMAVEILGEAFVNLRDASDAHDVMRTAIERANTAIYQMANDLPQLSSMATTIVALHMAENVATIAHVGDSRLYRVDRDGNLYRETDDHSMVAEEVRAGRMTEEQAENHPSRNIISRALGAEPTVDADIKTIMVDPGTSFLLCSDGITRHVGDQEIKGVLTFGGAAADICEYLKDLCYQRGAEDNLTAVVVKVAGTAVASTTAPSESIPLDDEEHTIATARPGVGDKISENEDELLDLDTHQIEFPIDHPLKPVVEVSTIQFVHDEPSDGIEPESDPILKNEIDITAEESVRQPVETELPSTFGDSATAHRAEKNEGSIAKVAGALGMLLLGIVIGMGVYYFAFPPKTVDTGIPKFSEMKAENIPLRAFEENRRDVDKNPAEYIAKFAAGPQDSEDFYLLGRAYLLTGDYLKARSSLTEAQRRIAEADPIDAGVLASDIAMALAVTNNTTIQNMLRIELDSTAPPPNRPLANANR